MKKQKNSLNSILVSIQNQAIPILKKAGVTRSSLFGSYVRGEAKANSDIVIQDAAMRRIEITERNIENLHFILTFSTI